MKLIFTIGFWWRWVAESPSTLIRRKQKIRKHVFFWKANYIGLRNLASKGQIAFFFFLICDVQKKNWNWINFLRMYQIVYLPHVFLSLCYFYHILGKTCKLQLIKPYQDHRKAEFNGIHLLTDHSADVFL